MASFANEHFEPYLQTRSDTPKYWKHNPVPDNVEQVKKLDDFTISILKDRRGSARNELINEDKVMERLQVKIRDIMEPFVHFGTLMRKPRTPMNCR